MKIIDFELIKESLHMIMYWEAFLALLVGTIVGVFFGAVPGINAPVAMAASLPFTYYLRPMTAILFLSALYTGGIFGGSISAILLNMPGCPGSVATAFDGFQLTRQGKHDAALGAALYSSSMGTFFSYIMMFFCITPIALLVRHLGPADRLFVGICAITIVAALRGKNLLRGLTAGIFGLMLGTLGPTETGIIRAQFLRVHILYDGLPLVPTIIGLIAFSELIGFLRVSYVVDGAVESIRPKVLTILSMFTLWVKKWPISLLGTVIGFIIGVVPAAGSTVGSLFAYMQLKSWSRHPEKYGQGALEGVIVSESANNASEGGAMLTMLTLGIPGSGASAILMSAFMMYGLIPGPVWIGRNLDFAYAVIIANLFLALGLILLGAILSVQLSSILFVPIAFLAPAIAVIGSAGTFSLRYSVIDIGILWFFAYLGYILKKYDFPPIAVLLGIILGPILDAEGYRVSRIFAGDMAAVFSRPVVLVSVFISILLITTQIYKAKKG